MAAPSRRLSPVEAGPPRGSSVLRRRRAARSPERHSIDFMRFDQGSAQDRHSHFAASHDL